jgi:hypothetical protein
LDFLHDRTSVRLIFGRVQHVIEPGKVVHRFPELTHCIFFLPVATGLFPLLSLSNNYFGFSGFENAACQLLKVRHRARLNRELLQTLHAHLLHFAHLLNGVLKFFGGLLWHLVWIAQFLDEELADGRAALIYRDRRYVALSIVEGITDHVLRRVLRRQTELLRLSFLKVDRLIGFRRRILLTFYFFLHLLFV